jgi:hypothetical protein
MGGASMGCSNKDEEANTPEELRHTTPTTSIETKKVSMHPTIRAFGAAAPTTTQFYHT